MPEYVFYPCLPRESRTRTSLQIPNQEGRIQRPSCKDGCKSLCLLRFHVHCTAVNKQEVYEQAEVVVCSRSTAQRYGSSMIGVVLVGGYRGNFDLWESDISC